MKNIETYELDENFRVEKGRYPQSRYCIFCVYADINDGTAVCHLTARWETTSLQDWEPNMVIIKETADAWQTAHNALVGRWNELDGKYGSVDYDGYEIALAEDAVMTNRGTNPTEAVMVADCLAFNPSTGEWMDGRVYWPIENDQAPDAVDYDSPDDLDLNTESSDPEDMASLLD